MKIVDTERAYWITDFENLAARMKQMAARSDRPTEIFQIGHTFGGRPIPGMRLGRGTQFNPLIVAGVHGAEVLGVYAALAIIDTLLNDTSPTGEPVDGWAQKILDQCTVTIIPLVNVDTAIRLREMMPSCDFNLHYSRDAADWDRYVLDYNEPRYYYEQHGEKVFQYGFTQDQMRRWQAQGKPLGLRYSDQGIDLFCDYKTFLAPETLAMRDFLKAERPCGVLEIHNQEQPAQVYVPVNGASNRDGLMQIYYAEEMMTRLMRRGLPGSRHSVRTYMYYLSDEYLQFPEYVYQEICPLSIFAEMTTGFLNDHYRKILKKDALYCRDVDAECPSRSARIQIGWSWMHTFLDLGVERKFA